MADCAEVQPVACFVRARRAPNSHRVVDPDATVQGKALCYCVSRSSAVMAGM